MSSVCSKDRQLRLYIDPKRHSRSFISKQNEHRGFDMTEREPVHIAESVRSWIAVAVCVFVCSVTGIRADTYAIDIEAGTGVPTRMYSDVKIIPRVGCDAMKSVTQSVYAGVLIDYAAYRSSSSEPAWAGGQWRILAVSEWEMAAQIMPRNWVLIGQVGLGGGRLHYEKDGGEETSNGPAGRVGLGVVRYTERMRISMILSLDRMDSAVHLLERKYPTAVNMSVRVGLR